LAATSGTSALMDRVGDGDLRGEHLKASASSSGQVPVRNTAHAFHGTADGGMDFAYKRSPPRILAVVLQNHDT